MAETRKYETGDGEGIQKLVREALGENIRPVAPGTQPEPAEEQAQEPEAKEEETSEASRVPGHLFGGGGTSGGSW